MLGFSDVAMESWDEEWFFVVLFLVFCLQRYNASWNVHMCMTTQLNV